MNVITRRRRAFLLRTSALKSRNVAFLGAFNRILSSSGVPQARPDQPGGAAGGDPRHPSRAR